MVDVEAPPRPEGSSWSDNPGLHRYPLNSHRTRTVQRAFLKPSLADLFSIGELALSMPNHELLHVGSGSGGAGEGGQSHASRKEAERALVLVKLGRDVTLLHVGTGDNPGHTTSAM